MDTSNAHYSKLKENLRTATSRLKQKKEKEVLNQNDKMFNRLLLILKRESASIQRSRKMANGPSSLNIGQRKREIQSINKGNTAISKMLNDAKCVVPSMDAIRAHGLKTQKLLRVASNRNRNGSPKVDPLVSL